MSELASLNNFARSSQNKPMAFCSLSGHQQGSIFELTAPKVVLQFEAADDNDSTPPIRCLVIQGNDGVTVRTIQGEVMVNNQVQRDVWIAVGSEVSCGASRLRLIRQTEVAAAPQFDSPNKSFDNAIADAKQTFGEEETTSHSYFGRLEPPKLDDDSSAGNMTLFLNPTEYKSILEPSVYGDEDVGYIAAPKIESAPETAYSNDPSPISTPIVCCDRNDSATTSPNAIEESSVEKQGLDDFEPKPPIVPTQPWSEPIRKPLVIDVSVQATRPQSKPIWSGVDVIEIDNTDSNFDVNSYSVCWQTNCYSTNHQTCELSRYDDVQGVIFH